MFSFIGRKPQLIRLPLECFYPHKYKFKSLKVPVTCVHTTPACLTFWEREKKSGYKTALPLPSKKNLILDGLKELKHEINMWKDEMKEKLESDPILVFRPGETDVIFDFKDKTSIDKWVVTTDMDHNEGKSTAVLELSSSGAGLFHGNVNSEHIKDGRIKRTGYANIRTKRVRVSLNSNTYLSHHLNMLYLHMYILYTYMLIEII